MDQKATPDLFGEIPVTWRDVQLWMFAVPRFAHTRRRAAWESYVRCWDVPGKIAREKAAGTFWEAVCGGLCLHCGQITVPDLPAAPAPSPAALAIEKARLERRILVLELLLRAQATVGA